MGVYHHAPLLRSGGSERVKPGAKKNTMAESANINKSIFSLATVIAKLSEASGKSSTFVPFRDSKLTRLLTHSLRGWCARGHHRQH